MEFDEYIKEMSAEKKSLVYAMIVLEVTDTKRLASVTGLKASRVKRTLKKIRDDLGVNSTVGIVAEFCRRGYHEKELSEWGILNKREGLAGFCDSVLG